MKHDDGTWMEHSSDIVATSGMLHVAQRHISVCHQTRNEHFTFTEREREQNTNSHHGRDSVFVDSYMLEEMQERRTACNYMC